MSNPKAQILVLNMSSEEFSSFLSDTIREVVKQELQENTPPPKIEYLKKSQVCEMLHITPRRLATLISMGTIKCYDFHGAERLIRSEVENAMMPVKNLQYRRIAR